MSVRPEPQRPASGSEAAVPRHVAIIMDGNGRWAKARGLPRSAGHRAGAEAARKALRAAGEAGVECLTLYAFSSENWRRPAAASGPGEQISEHRDHRCCGVPEPLDWDVSLPNQASG